MVKNRNIKVRNTNGTEAVLSGAVIVQYLRDYTSDWGDISTQTVIEGIESEFTPAVGDDKYALEKFNSKIGFVLPVITLPSLIDEVIATLKDTDTRYLTMFQSFNNLEKVAIYFILAIQDKWNVTEVFEMLITNYKDISKRDIMIRLISEVEVEESDNTVTDPINGLYKLLSVAKTHGVNTEPVFEYKGGEIEFKEFTFPMHSYNTTKRFGGHEVTDNASIRNYYELFQNTWHANVDLSKNSKWFDNNSPLYKTDNWKTILKDNVMSNISGSVSNRYNIIHSTRDLLDELSWHEYSFNVTEERPLFKYLGEHFFDFNPNAGTTDDQTSRAPLTMTKYTSNTSQTSTRFTRANLIAGLISYTGDFSNFKTVLSYYASDINFWLTADDNSTNTDYANYEYNESASGFLPSSAKSETKGYFSNIMFLQSAIQRILYPKILKASQGGYNWRDSLSTNLFYTSDDVYENIFDSIVNNSFVYTDKDVSLTSFNSNYEIIPNRAVLNMDSGFINTNATNLYEFIINSIVSSKDDITGDSTRTIITSDKLDAYNRQDLLYKSLANVDYNPLSSQIVSDTTSLTLSDFDSDSIVYDFGTGEANVYNPSTNNWIDKIVSTFFKMDHAGDNYDRIIYEDMKFFKLPVHDAGSIAELNRNIQRVDRELLTDITDLSNFDIKGLKLADFTYGEKTLLKEYISNFRSIKKLPQSMTEMEIIKKMIIEIDDLADWKADPSIVSPDNTYYKITAEANPMPSNANTNPADIIAYYNYLKWQKKIYDLKKTIYFPEDLSINDISDIQDFLGRTILEKYRNRTFAKDSDANSFISQIKEFVRNSAINIKYEEKYYSSNKQITLNSISNNFLKSLKLIISTIKKTSAYETAFDNFTADYQEGVWIDIVTTVNGIRDVLLDSTQISDALIANNLYGADKSAMLKEFDVALYKASIINYFAYLTSGVEVETQISDVVFVDNTNTGIIRYYSDVLSVIKFTEQYLKLVPKYIEYLNDNVLDKFYKRIEAIKTLPTWDYESFHRRDNESDLKKSAGVNTHDYNIVFSTASNNISVIYKGSKGRSSSYKVNGSIYKGGLSYTEGENIWRDRWWRKWVTDGSDTYSYSEIESFKVPCGYIKDYNINLPATWEYDTPNHTDKRTWFFKMKNNSEVYQKGGVASMSSFKYSITPWPYFNIGVPLLLLGDDASEWNKANTVREKSFSFETDFLNLWHTDEGYSDGQSLNNGGGEAYTSSGYELVSGADKYREFGLGNMNIQEMFRYFWNMESSPMGNPYNVMNYNIFDTWDFSHTAADGNFPWSTIQEINWLLQVVKKSNIYDFKFVLKQFYKEGFWSPIRLSGENRSIGVDPDVTLTQIRDNFYFPSKEYYNSNDELRDGIFDIYNRNFRNRVYLSYLRWRYLHNQGVW